MTCKILITVMFCMSFFVTHPADAEIINGTVSPQLTEKRQKLYSLFKIAIEEEKKSQKLYSDMLQNAEETSLKYMLESFIKQEKNYEEALIRIYSDLRKTDEFKD